MHFPIARSQAFAEPERFRRLARPLPLLLLPGSVVGTLVVMGGAAAVVVGFFALVLALDRAFPLAGAAMPTAEYSFRRLARERRREARRRPRGEHRLVYLSEGEGWAALAERRPLGVQAIAVDSIVGTVEPEKAAAFDRRCRPPPWTRERWTRMWLAAQRGAALPP